MSAELHDHRIAASQASGGISDDAIYAMALARLRENGPAQAALDFGAGQGFFAHRLLQSGLYKEVAAADLMPRPSSLPERLAWHQGDLNEPLGLPSSSFDVIAAIEVIEHLENPRAMLRDCFRLLRPGGLLVITTPNNESVRSFVSLLLRGHFAAFGAASYPAHITPLLRIDLYRAATEAGFTEPALSFSNHGVVPRLTDVSWQKLSFRFLGGRLFSDNLLFSCRKPLT